MIGSAEAEPMSNVRLCAERFGLPHEVLATAEMGRRYPQHRSLPGEIGILDHWAGVLRPEFAVLAAARAAQSRGARLVTGCRVSAVEPVDGGVRVRAGDRVCTVERAVVAVGPWTARFAPDLAGHVTAKKLVMTWYPALDVAAYQPDRFPIFIRQSGQVHIFGIPTLDGGSVKVAPGTPYRDLADADDLDRNVAPGDLVAINSAVADLLPGLVPTPVRVSSYLDAYTSDGHGLVGRMPGAENVWLFGAFSGHGFKMAPAFGQVAAELVTEGRTSLPIDHLDPARFGK
jgi:sarcosine oxidase